MRPIGEDTEGLFREIELKQMPPDAIAVFREFGRRVYFWGLEYSHHTPTTGEANRDDLTAIVADLRCLSGHLTIVATHGGATADERRLARLAKKQLPNLEELILSLSTGLGQARRRAKRLARSKGKRL